MATALQANQQVFFQRPGFRVGKGQHGVLLQRIIGDVLHDFDGSLFLGEIEWAGPVHASCDNTPQSHLQPLRAVSEGRG